MKPEVAEIKRKDVPKVISTQVEDWNGWLESVKNVEDEWLKRKLDPAVEKLKKQINEIREKEEEFVVEKGSSALKEFATQFTVEGKVGFFPHGYLRAVICG